MDKIIISLVLEFIPPPQNTFHISQPLPSHPQTKDGGGRGGASQSGQREKGRTWGVQSEARVPIKQGDRGEAVFFSSVRWRV